MIGVCAAASVMAAAVLMSASVLRAASVLHAALLAAVLRLPMAHFETTPTGRLLNRFSKDVDAVDNTLTYILRGWVMHLLSVRPPPHPPLLLPFIRGFPCFFRFCRSFRPSSSSATPRPTSSTSPCRSASFTIGSRCLFVRFSLSIRWDRWD